MSEMNVDAEVLVVNGERYVKEGSLNPVSLSNRSIVRCRNAGIHVGVVVNRNSDVLTLENSNRIYRWRGANTLSEIALHGVNRHEHTRISEELPFIELTCSDVCEVLPVAEGVDLSEVWND